MAGVQFVWTLRLYSSGHMKTMTSERFDEVAVPWPESYRFTSVHVNMVLQAINTVQ